MNKMFRFSCLLIFYLSYQFEVSNLSAQDVRDNRGQYEINDIAMTLAVDEAGSIRSVADLGGLIANKTYQIDFRIQNPFDFDIEFESTRSSCNCTEVKFEQLKIPAGKSVLGIISYKTPDFAKEGKLEFNLLLQHRTQTPTGNLSPLKTAAMLQFTAYLRGVIDLGSSYSSRVFEVRDTIDEYAIPIVITEPVKFEDLEVSVSSELKDVSAEIVNIDNQILIKITAAKNALPPSGIAGSLTVSHRPSKTEKALLLTVTPQLPVRISPSFLAFSDSSQDDRIVEATAIIRVNRLAAKPEEESEQDSSNEENSKRRPVSERVSISDCKMGDFHLEHELHGLSDSIWKVRFRIAKQNYQQFLETRKQQVDRDGTSGLEVRFRIRVGEDQHKMQVKVFEE